MIKVYNTLTRKKEPFKPLKDKEVNMYVCGITVYDLSHLGHARIYISFDVIQRYLEYKGYKVNKIHNFTDIDDKIINRAYEENKKGNEIAEKYINEFFKDIKNLNLKPASIYPKATETINEIIEFIKDLMNKGYAYETSKGVYFNITKYKEYGKLSKVDLEELKKHRIEPDPEKKDPRDFALWKKATEKDIQTGMYYDSPFGKGRPGWHIECSAMCLKHLGETIDIHGGGKDLIFPHHENEIAQSESKNNKPFAKYWMHVEFLNINKEKMSKSLKNFITIRDALKIIPPDIIRFMFSSVHYRRPMNYSEQEIKNAKNNYERIKNSLENLISEISYLSTFPNKEKRNKEIESKATSILKNFEKAMDDDFNTSKALTNLFELTKLTNTYLEKETNIETLKHLYKIFKTITDIYGIFPNLNIFRTLTQEEKQAILEREEARKSKDFKTSDLIRDRLKEKGIELKDTNKGVRWTIHEKQ